MGKTMVSTGIFLHSCMYIIVMRISEILRVQWITPIFQFRVPSWIRPWTGQQLFFRRVIISQMNVEAIGRTVD